MTLRKTTIRRIQQVKDHCGRAAPRREHIPDFLLILAVIAFPLGTYPWIYGADAFQIMWMGNAIRNGALFSENSWLIHFSSYFGMYPFSHRAVGVPLLLAVLTTIIDFVSAGALGLAEAILVLDVVLILAIYRCSRDLGEVLFEERWSQFIFTAAVLLSPNVLSDSTMTVSTRIFITLIMITLLRLSIQVIYVSDGSKNFAVFKMILLLSVGALIHRLWIGTLVAVGLAVLVHIVRKNSIIRKSTLIMLIPLAIIGFFAGLSVFHVDPRKIWSPFLDNSTLLGIFMNLTLHELLQIGLIFVFFPIGVIVMLYKEIRLLLGDLEKGRNNDIVPHAQRIHNKNFYLLLFIPLFSTMVPTFYSTTIFLPIQIIFSVHGLVYCKNYLSDILPMMFRGILPLAVLLLSTMYSLAYFFLIIEVNLWYLQVLLSIGISAYLAQFILCQLSRRSSSVRFKNSFFASYKSEGKLKVLVLILAILIFSTTTVTGRMRSIDSSEYPWENRYLTSEEQEVIAFFQTQDVSGLIYTNVPVINSRISGIAFLPVINDRESIGTAIYYNLITPQEVHERTLFSLSGISRLRFYIFTGEDPIRAFRNSISHLNVSLEEDLNALEEDYHVQYIITRNEAVLSTESNWNLTQSLPEAFAPVFETDNLLVWKIY